MADYFTLQGIANRLGYKNSLTILRLIRCTGLPAYKRRSAGSRDRWYINDDLIRIWELSMAEKARQKMIERRERRLQAVAASTQAESHIPIPELSSTSGISVATTDTEESQDIEKVDK